MNQAGLEEVEGPPPREKSVNQRLDDLDLRIVECIRAGGQRSARDLAKELGISPATANRRVRKLLEEGAILGYHAVLDYERIGYAYTAIILLQADGVHLVDVENELKKKPEVQALYDITGEYDAVILARFRNRDELNKFVKSTLSNPYVKRTVTSIVLNVMKEDYLPRS